MALSKLTIVRTAPTQNPCVNCSGPFATNARHPDMTQPAESTDTRDCPKDPPQQKSGKATTNKVRFKGAFSQAANTRVHYITNFPKASQAALQGYRACGYISA